MNKYCLKSLRALALLAACILWAGAAQAAPAGQILIGPKASPMEQYAARELQHYLYQLSGDLPEVGAKGPKGRGPLFVVGQRQTNPLIAKLAEAGQIHLAEGDPGAQGYVLKTLALDGRPALVIAGADETGCLYGVYGLLEKYYRVGFYIGGDVLPDAKAPLALPTVDERTTPAVAIRGFLPWTNFPQSATSYSWEDWKSVIDRMARMRLNFIHIHNYNGEGGHNEMFHNFTFGGKTSRTWMATARTGHGWSGPKWDVNKFRFGASDLFDDYDFGADCTLHNEKLTNEQVFRKGASEFQKVIAYAHSRGVKMGLGLDINLIPGEYGAKAEDPAVVAARVDQVTRDYPDLDYLLCFQSEGIARDAVGFAIWRKIFMGFHDGLKAKSPKTRLAVSGWGLDPKSIAELPEDVICAPISAYSDKCETGAIYGNREYWGCPWLERDFVSCVYYYPYNMHLSNTVEAWHKRAPNMKGFYCLSWRLTDAIDPKLSFISKAPWDSQDKYKTGEDVYRDYAALNYGPEAASEITKIINQNEPVATDWSECMPTPMFSAAGIGGGFLLNVENFSTSVHGQPVNAKPIPAASFSQQSGVQKAECVEGGQCVGFIEAGDWIQIDSVDFGAGADLIEVRVASDSEGGQIQIRLDSMEGPVIGVIVVNNTGGWQKWVTRQLSINAVQGRHHVIMQFLGKDISVKELLKADHQLARIDECIGQSDSPANQARLKTLRCRIAAEQAHIQLNCEFSNYTWGDLPGTVEPWAKNFTGRVTDISSLGSVMSSQNRFVQLNYVARENELRKALAIQPPSAAEARGTAKGAVITWKNEQAGAKGFRVYRNGEKVSGPELLPATAASFEDKDANHLYRYTVTAVSADDKESSPSVPYACKAGSADTDPPQIVVVSPPTSGLEGQPASVKARLLDGRTFGNLSATLCYRTPGQRSFSQVAMERRVKGVFVAQIPGKKITASGVEYYVQASDGKNQATFPPQGGKMALFMVATPDVGQAAPGTPQNLAANGLVLSWAAPSQGPVFWYRIYRSDKPDFEPGPASFLTYVEKGTTSYQDNGEDLMGRKLAGKWYYRIAAASKEDLESQPTQPVAVDYSAK